MKMTRIITTERITTSTMRIFIHMCEALRTEEKIEINGVAKWMDIDKLDSGFEFLSDEELIQQILKEDCSE